MERQRDQPIVLDGLSVEFRLEDDPKVWQRVFSTVRGRRLPKRLPATIQFAVDAEGRALHIDVGATRAAGQNIDWVLYMHLQDSIEEPDRLSKRIGCAAGLGKWIERLHARTVGAALSCSATFECDQRRSTSVVLFPEQIPRELAPSGNLTEARIYSLGIEQGDERISIEIERPEERLSLAVAFQMEVVSLGGLLDVVEEEAWRHARKWIQEVPGGTAAKK